MTKYFGDTRKFSRKSKHRTTTRVSWEISNRYWVIYKNFVAIKISIKYPKSYEAIFDPWFGFSREHYAAMCLRLWPWFKVTVFGNFTVKKWRFKNFRVSRRGFKNFDAGEFGFKNFRSQKLGFENFRA